MSYSRWSNSTWYTYWHCGEEKDRHVMDKQLFDVCGVMMFTYKELAEDLDGCIARLKHHIENHDKEARENMFCMDSVTDEELEELKGYMKEFMEDVQADLGDPLYEDLKKVEKMSNKESADGDQEKE